MAGLSKSQYVDLAQFRFALRKFIHFSEAAASKEKLAPQQHQLLLAIKGNQDRDWLTIKEVAEALVLKHHSAVELIDRSEANGIVERLASKEDRRLVRVHITRAGEEILERLTAIHLEEVQLLTDVLGTLPKTG